MRSNILRQRLQQGAPTLGTHIHTTWPSMVEAIGHTGHYDYVEFVAEYAPFDLHDLDNLGRAGDLYDLSMMIKVDAEHRAYVAQRAVGSGFHSVLFADVRSAEDAAECVRCVRADHPDEGGTYGVATRRFTYMGYGGSKAYVEALRDVVVVVMIEKQSAVDQLEEILDVDGVERGQWNGSHSKVEELEEFERYARSNLGLREQSRLKPEQVEFVTPCLAQHRNLTLQF